MTRDGAQSCVFNIAGTGRVRSGIMSIVLFLANILLHMHPISST